ncbi:hypothetical protein J6590_102703 [Homalodisca vitripennis]|nr:hypothetical protein J6590_102703 [Homalodisca vitripennis]
MEVNPIAARNNESFPIHSVEREADNTTFAHNLSYSDSYYYATLEVDPISDPFHGAESKTVFTHQFTVVTNCVQVL